MTWSDESSYPVDERTFRAKLWREVVRNDSHAIAGLPARCERTFIEIALQRARTLTAFVPSGDLDAEAIQALHHRSLIAHPESSLQLSAPAHDVLEDWALLAWLELTFEQVQQDPALLAAQVEGFPALRRAYRKWLGEILDLTPAMGDAFILAACKTASLSPQFRDDTMVSVLLSSAAKTFLERHRAELLQHDAVLLKRVIHLLRIAAVSKPYWVTAPNAPSAYMVPIGTAWEAVLSIVHENANQLLPREGALLVGLLSDWAKGVNIATPYPPGAEAASKLGFLLLPHLEGYRQEELRKRVLSAILKVPKGNTPEFLKLVELASTFEPHPRDYDDIRALLLDGIESAFACRDFPDEIIAFALRALCLPENEVDDDDWSNSIDEEFTFGIRPGLKSDFFPASAWRGPFRSLLRWHAEKGVDFILRFVNHSIQTYAERSPQRGHYDPPEQVTLTIPGHGSVTQGCNDRLWSLYRATTVGPPLLQSALMALEDWLLENSANPKFDLEGWLFRLLTQTNNACITAIVASLSIAHPFRAGRVGVALLTCQQLFRLDRVRMMRENQSPSHIARLLPSIRAGDDFHEHERKTADTLEHRWFELEQLSRSLQLTSHREQVWQIIDDYRKAMPDPSDQSEEDKLWRLALHRMDIRHYRIATEEEKASILEKMPKESSSSRSKFKDNDLTGRVILCGGPVDADIQAMVDQDEPERKLFESHLVLVNWGNACWDNRDAARSVEWRAMLEAAKQRASEEGRIEFFARGGAGLVTAVCVRDHWQELSTDDQSWCVEKLLEAVDADCDSTDQLVQVTRMPSIPSRYAAYVLPFLLQDKSSQLRREPILRAVAKALTHASNEVVEYAAAGVGFYLAQTGTSFILRYALAMSTATKKACELVHIESERRYDQRRRGSEIVQTITSDIRALITQEATATAGKIALDFEEWPTRAMAKPLLEILARCPNIPEAQEVFASLAKQLVSWWDRDRSSKDEPRRDHHFEHACPRLICRFALALAPDDALRVCQPLIAAADSHPRELTNLVWNALIVEVQSEGPSSFWILWKAISERILKTSWIGDLESPHSTGTELLYRMFLGREWGKGVHHWRRLDDCPSCIDTFFEQLPPTPIAWQNYCTFLYTVGGKSLPQAFVRLANQLDTTSRLLSAENTVFFLESIVRRYVYSTPQTLKKDARLKTATLKLLDALVEAGSSSAYRMRDDFVTPLGHG